jgi:transcriptional regulator with XRE-family HTH domain
LGLGCGGAGEYSGGMDAKREISEFLRTRRARLTPEQAGIQTYGLNRKVQGLRREEVALLAGVSVDYYTRIERGNIAGASPSVLEALARALQLSDVERDHLNQLAALSETRRPARPVQHLVRPQHQLMLDAITDAPAYIGNARMDVLATNALCAALYEPILSSPVAGRNLARFVFLDPSSVSYWQNWSKIAEDSAATLRVMAGKFPNEPMLHQLIGELVAKSEYFSSLWQKQNVYRHGPGEKSINHPEVGELTFTYDGLVFGNDDYLKLVIYTCEPTSPTGERLRLLASLAATRAQESTEA